MGGLGLGSAWLGRRSERARKPLVYYAKLELWIALSAAATPGLVLLVREAYAATGGSFVLAHEVGTAVRLGLAALVLIVPTFLMGGTLPAAARAVQTDADPGRRSLAILYGCNTMGAVTGAALSTFWLIEFFGNRDTLWLACVLNILVAFVARKIGQRLPDAPEADELEKPAVVAEAAPWFFVMVAAAVVGFAFMLMELVWYRMLGPILGGSTFTFGLILTVALIGVGLGGAAYGLLSTNRRPTLNGFALTCALEALLIALPYALGDRLAFLALMLRPLGFLGFSGQVLGWALIAIIVILPAALLAGYQFPMIIALLGRGRANVGRQTGFAYAANTTGAILGSLVGGFGLLPILTAVGAWKAVTILLIVLALLAVLAGVNRRETVSFSALVAAGCACLALTAAGPTAAWRHSGIGAGRAPASAEYSANYFREFRNQFRRTAIWEAEGVESSVGILNGDSLAFVINGKVDGNSRGDAGTQVMSGMAGAILHPNPKRALVIGLGTGSTAGWLGSIPGMEQVDVVELEPAVIEVARQCAAVNQNVLGNPKVKIYIGDGREVLLTAPGSYDLIFSEPSNPYRAGIASLFTVEFYEAIKKRLAPGGIFLQWMQSYEIDSQAIRSVYATLGSVFPSVETWRTQSVDLLLVATREKVPMDAAALRSKILTEPYRSALLWTWRVDSLEGFLANHIASDRLTRAIVATGEPLCTDNRNALEFGFARGVGQHKSANLVEEIMRLAKQWKIDRPAIEGEINWESVAAQAPTLDGLMHHVGIEDLPGENPARGNHRSLIGLFEQKRFSEAAALIKERAIEPLNHYQLYLFAMIYARLGDDRALPFIEALEAIPSPDAGAVRAHLHVQRKEWKEAGAILETIFLSWRTDPWAQQSVVSEALADAVTVAANAGNRDLARRLFDLLAQPFAVSIENEGRLLARVNITRFVSEKPLNEHLLAAINGFGPLPPWRLEILQLRLRIFQEFNDPRTARAAADVAKFRSSQEVPFKADLVLQ